MLLGTGLVPPFRNVIHITGALPFYTDYLVILLTVFRTILVMLVLSIWYWIN